MVHKLLDEMNEQMIIKKARKKNRCNMMCSATNSEKKQFASIQFQVLNNNRKQTHGIEMKPRVK